MIGYRWKATRSPSSEILSWLLTSGELVLSRFRSTESSAINEYSAKTIARNTAVVSFMGTPKFCHTPVNAHSDALRGNKGVDQ
jgi:hypothetical protein